MSEKLKTVTQIAKEFGYTETSVRKWLKNGLSHKIEKVQKIKPRIVIDPIDVKKYLNIGIK